jgi:hypothetical protein
MKTVEQIMFEIKKKYDKKPENWSVLRGRDKRGHYDTYILGAEVLWHMKTEWKTPYRPIGVGRKINDFPEKVRHIVEEEGEYFLIGEIYPQPKNSALIAIGIGKYSPTATNSLKRIISGQDVLEEKMNRELKKLLKKEEMMKEYI